MDSGDLAGSVLEGRYQVHEAISRGAMGVVYRAERMGLGKVVAIKVMHDELPDELSARKRFEIEAMAMAKLEHPHCAAVVDVGVHEGRPFVVMDFVSGTDVKDLVEKGPLPIPRAIAIMRQVLAGVAHAHELGIIHRDIKPANVMLSQKAGVGDFVRVLDFGLARLTAEQTVSKLTTGIVVGTPAYMAPEQIRGHALDGRADLYACGVMLMELLTGQKPFTSATDDPMEVVSLHLRQPPPRLDALLPGTRFGPLEDVVAKALAKKADDRYQTAAQFTAALDEAAKQIDRGDFIEAAQRVRRPDDNPPPAGSMLGGPAPIATETGWAVPVEKAPSTNTPAPLEVSPSMVIPQGETRIGLAAHKATPVTGTPVAGTPVAGAPVATSAAGAPASGSPAAGVAAGAPASGSPAAGVAAVGGGAPSVAAAPVGGTPVSGTPVAAGAAGAHASGSPAGPAVGGEPHVGMHIPSGPVPVVGRDAAPSSGEPHVGMHIPSGPVPVVGRDAFTPSDGAPSVVSQLASGPAVNAPHVGMHIPSGPVPVVGRDLPTPSSGEPHVGMHIPSGPVPVVASNAATGPAEGAPHAATNVVSGPVIDSAPVQDAAPNIASGPVPSGPQANITTSPVVASRAVLGKLTRTQLLVGGGVLIVLVIGIIAATSGGEKAAPVAKPTEQPIEQPEIEMESGRDAQAEQRMIDKATAALEAKRYDEVIDTLTKARAVFPDNAMMAYLVGKAYFGKLWWTDGLRAFRDALRLEPDFRNDPELIKTVLAGFITTPSYNRELAAFLREDIGAAAEPYLDETAQEHPNPAIRKRAADELKRYQPTLQK